MKSFLLAAVAASALFAAAAPASAQGKIDGFYAGSSIGGTAGSHDTAITGTAFKADLSSYGFVTGAFAGYGMTFGSLYAGVEGQFDVSTAKGSATGVYKVENPYTGAAVARLGYVLPSALLYVNGGWAYSQFKVNDYVVGVKTDKWTNAVRVGAGLEYNMGNGMFTRVGYDVDFSSEKYPLSSVKADTVRQTAKIGIGYRF